jgi:prepilin-type N-terminal cleavage/methylation domain-containing protein
MFRPPFRSHRPQGFSLVEMLLVLVIIGVISGIAIPSYLGQRRRARVIGDAISNAKVLQMGLESLKADTGIYGSVSGYDWKADGSGATGLALIPTFQPSGNSKMNYHVDIATSGITYLLAVNDPTMTPTLVYSTNQLGQELYRLK